ncbi:MAG: tRNA (adenosine(37)-N6)-threonylcarbamoyltransferase complex transferase subunit TsaD [Rhodothermales bacterium]
MHYVPSSLLLAIETSCDDTAAAILSGSQLRSSIISSQLLHEPYGGVVPEIASRMHQRMIVPVVTRALEEAGVGRKEVEAVAVTVGPGLAGSLLVGISFAKAMAFGLGVPLVGVNHLDGHVYSVFIECRGPSFPFLCLVVSGGHTQLMLIRGPLDHVVLGRTRDDAAGEAFDKIGKLLGLEYPAGPAIDRLARSGDPRFHRFPRSRPGRFDFSFSGLKTSVLYFLNALSEDDRQRFYDEHMADICASVQEAIVDVLVDATADAIEETGVTELAVVGGVSANSRLRRRAETMARQMGVAFHAPEPRYCTDNAAMIAMAGRLKLESGHVSSLSLTASPSLSY